MAKNYALYLLITAINVIGTFYISKGKLNFLIFFFFFFFDYQVVVSMATVPNTIAITIVFFISMQFAVRSCLSILSQPQPNYHLPSDLATR